jgi:hypothetical protein
VAVTAQPLEWQYYFADYLQREEIAAKNWIWGRHQYLEDLPQFDRGS